MDMPHRVPPANFVSKVLHSMARVTNGIKIHRMKDVLHLIGEYCAKARNLAAAKSFKNVCVQC